MTFGLIILITFILLAIFGGVVAFTPLLNEGYSQYVFYGMLTLIMITIIVMYFTHEHLSKDDGVEDFYTEIVNIGEVCLNNNLGTLYTSLCKKENCLEKSRKNKDRFIGYRELSYYEMLQAIFFESYGQKCREDDNILIDKLININKDITILIK